MELPIELKEKIEEEISKVGLKDLQKSAQNISSRYRDEEKTKTTTRLIQNKEDALSYAVSRMPATYGAINSALEHTLEILKINNIDYKKELKTLLDIGAGTGTASWCASEYLDLENITCIENEINMLSLGKQLMQANNKIYDIAKWKRQNVLTENIEEKADVLITAYMLNELNKENLNSVLEKIWNATNKLLLIVEPGTPESYNRLMKIRKYFIDKNAEIVAPCPHTKECKIQNDDWCSFSCRVARTKIHKLLKDGDVPYEDEKFCYIALYKGKIQNKESRILRHPKIESGLIRLKVCNKDTSINEVTITKRDKELFKKAKKSKAGDIMCK